MIIEYQGVPQVLTPMTQWESEYEDLRNQQFRLILAVISGTVALFCVCVTADVSVNGRDGNMRLSHTAHISHISSAL